MRYFFSFVILFTIVSLTSCAGRPSGSLYDAIAKNDHAKLEQLLKSTNPEQLDQPGLNELIAHLVENDNPTPLQYACQCGDLETIRMLVEAGADVAHGGTLWYVFHRRDGSDRFTVAKYMIDAGAEFSHQRLTDAMVLKPEELNDEATCREQLELVRTMYELREAELGVPMVEAHPGLLATAAGESGIPVIEFLLEKGYPVNPEPDPETGHVEGLTPLGHAAWTARTQAVEYLLSKGADVHLRGYNNQTALEYALQKREQAETLRSNREYWTENYDRIIEILKKAEG